MHLQWTGGRENNWWCPPPSLVVRVLRHVEMCKALGTLVVPGWQSAAYWPIIWPTDSSLATFVTEITSLLPLFPHLVCPGRSAGALFKQGNPNTPMLAIRICFLNRH